MTKILLVEDDKNLREIYGVRLLAEGYDIVSAGDGEEALAMAIKERPALILSDVMMPKISGFDMLDILRSTTETRDVKVIMMTALSSDDQRHRSEVLGADRYLVKSQVGIEDVVRTVHDVLGDTPAPVSAPADDSSSPLPQPTPPAQPPRPARPNDRVIQPLEPAQTNQPPISIQIEQELAQPAPQNQPTVAPVGGASIIGGASIVAEPSGERIDPALTIPDRPAYQPTTQPATTPAPEAMAFEATPAPTPPAQPTADARPMPTAPPRPQPSPFDIT